MTERFGARSLTSPRLVAEMLLCEVLGCSRIKLYMEADRPTSPEELARLRDLVIRASDREPVHYLVGRAAFFGREFLVDRSTQIPQPCTEDLVSCAIDLSRDQAIEAGGNPRIADVGTGCGCIAVTLAIQIPAARIVATDIAPEALALAVRNADRFQVADRIEFVAGPLLQPLRDRAAGGLFDIICSNPPSIPDHEWEGGEVEESVRRYVPERALRGGPEGLDIIRPLIAGAGELLAPDGRVVIEIADCQRDAVIKLVQDSGWLHRPVVLRDHEGFNRMLVAERR